MLVDSSVKSLVNRLRLGGSGNDTEEVRSLYKSGNGESKGVGRNLVDGLEATVVNLLITADLVKLNRFNDP